MIDLPCLPNLVSSTIKMKAPWNFDTDIPDSAMANKLAFRAWSRQNTTDHCYFSGWTGVVESQRVSKKVNEPQYVQAIIADYDVKNLTRDSLTKAIEESVGDIPPTFSTLTYSNGARLIWVLGSEIPIASPKLAKKFLKIAAQQLKVSRIVAALDPAFFSPYEYYEVGKDWVQHSPEPLPKELAWLWYAEISQTETLGSRDEIRIPLDRVEAEIHQQFPNKLSDKLEVGLRTPRFWDSSATDPTAAVVKEGGFLCFTGPEPFISWASLLGNAFVNEFRAARIGAVLQENWFDGSKFWRELPDGTWHPVITSDFRTLCKVRYELEFRVDKEEAFSEVDQAVVRVQEEKRISAALPFVHFPAGPIKLRGNQVINTAKAECMQPAVEKVHHWGRRFPWLKQFLEELFGEEQLPYFIAWAQRFYLGGLVQKPELGQALFLVGPTTCGKTLISTFILAEAVGGYMDATEFIVEGSSFSGSYLEAPIMAVDDGEPTSNRNAKTKYSARIKKVVANPGLLYNAKYAKEGLVDWRGRIIVTLNDDPSSLKMLPELQESLMDKLLVLKVHRQKKKFPPASELEPMILGELPYFLSYLVHLRPQGEVVGNSRFGVKSFIHEELRQEALSSSQDHAFMEILTLYFSEYSVEHPDKTYWEGSATELVSELTKCELTRGLMKDYTPIRVGRNLGTLISLSLPILRKRSRQSVLWRIPLDLGDLEVQG